MQFDIVTIFPGLFAGFFEHGIVRRAQTAGLVTVNLHDLRTYTHDRHRTVDDRPFGGGEGMVLKPEPLAEALEAIGVSPKDERAFTLPTLGAEMRPEDGAPSSRKTDAKTRIVLMSAQGRPFTQAVAREFAKLDRVVMICGRYEGVDERINELFCDEEISIGDYVLSGGELAAAVVLDATMRLLPGVLGNEASGEFESFGVADTAITTDEEGVPRSQHGAGGLLDYPHYTRPADFRGMKAPEVLLGGDHQQIRKWRREQQLRKTLANRPDLLARAELSAEDRKMLDGIDPEWQTRLPH